MSNSKVALIGLLFVILVFVDLGGLDPSLVAEDGVMPKDKFGLTLNFDFESGTLDGWTIEGDAFAGQPIHGDTVNQRRDNMQSRHQGKKVAGRQQRG